MKKFNFEDAEKCLPAVSKLMKRAQRLRDKIIWLIGTTDVSVEVASEEGFHFFLSEHVSVNKEFHKLYYQFYHAMEKLKDLGALVRDIDEGLVDFPSALNGKDIFLSWSMGEDKIRFWRAPDNDVEERRPIVDVDELFREKDL